VIDITSGLLVTDIPRPGQRNRLTCVAHENALHVAADERQSTTTVGDPRRVLGRGVS
jgi:hypothetical protein